MTKHATDSKSPTFTFNSIAEILSFVYLLFLFLATVYTFQLLIRGKLLNLKKKIGKLSVLLISLYLAGIIFTALVMYIDCPKIVALFYALLFPMSCLVAVLGMLDVMKSIVQSGSFLTAKLLSRLEILIISLHWILVGPYYYLFRYSFSDNEFSIFVPWAMYALFNCGAFTFLLWQLLYFNSFLHHHSESLQKVCNMQQTKEHLTLRHKLIGAIVVQFVGVGGNIVLTQPGLDLTCWMV
jgi:aromatic ring-cleaving dioxygenase